ncbi:uncharacterized protein TNCV_1974961 [Trichonephila clavipes]|nr:uncharacterized protein TNCV_1974961 [Trichonephila clavipes]
MVRELEAASICRVDSWSPSDSKASLTKVVHSNETSVSASNFALHVRWHPVTACMLALSIGGDTERLCGFTPKSAVWSHKLSFTTEHVSKFLGRQCSTWTGTSCHQTGKVDGSALVLDNSRITMGEIHRLLDISVGTTRIIMHQHLDFQKICARWVPNQLTIEQRNTRIALSLSHLQRYHEEEYGFLSQIVTGDETWSNNHLNAKASVRASSENVLLHHLQRNQRPCTPVLFSSSNLVIKVLDSLLTCHEFEPSTAEDPPSRAMILSHMRPTDLLDIFIAHEWLSFGPQDGNGGHVKGHSRISLQEEKGRFRGKKRNGTLDRIIQKAIKSKQDVRQAT